jgi:hypothetical protein
MNGRRSDQLFNQLIPSSLDDSSLTLAARQTFLLRVKRSVWDLSLLYRVTTYLPVEKPPFQ